MKSAQSNHNRLGRITEPNNDASFAIGLTEPYTVSVTIRGVADLLFHRWSCESVKAKAGAAKNSAVKKTDDIESYVYRCENGNIAIPGEYLRQAVIAAAKFRQDPRSPRKSAQDLYKAAVMSMTPLADTGLASWDYLDTRRVVIQRNGVNRTRPALKAGWQVSFDLMVTLPEYVAEADLHEMISMAGRLIGMADFRPTYGRFAVTGFSQV